MSPGEESTGRAVALSEEERAALRWFLDNFLPQLRYQEARIDLPRDRHEVVVKEEALTRLRARLG